MTNEQNSQTRNYDLEERTAKFGEEVIRFAKRVPNHEITRPLILQLVRAGTSIGANYCEADDAETGKDFKHKIGICKKESRETKHWLRMIVVACPELENEAKALWQEAKELNLIFNAIVNKLKKGYKEVFLVIRHFEIGA
ncbi:MAG: four helix bundle protein [Patescibacteria group bacterium]